MGGGGGWVGAMVVWGGKLTRPTSILLKSSPNYNILPCPVTQEEGRRGSREEITGRRCCWRSKVRIRRGSCWRRNNHR